MVNIVYRRIENKWRNRATLSYSVKDDERWQSWATDHNLIWSVIETYLRYTVLQQCHDEELSTVGYTNFCEHNNRWVFGKRNDVRSIVGVVDLIDASMTIAKPACFAQLCFSCVLYKLRRMMVAGSLDAKEIRPTALCLSQRMRRLFLKRKILDGTCSRCHTSTLLHFLWMAGEIPSKILAFWRLMAWTFC